MNVYTPESARIHIQRHQAYIAAGHCPSVDKFKSWCNARRGHSINHVAHGEGIPSVYWTDREADSCPCYQLPD